MAQHAQVGPKSYRLINEARRIVGARAGFQRGELPGGTPKTIGPVAMDLLEQTLANGCVRQLLVRGGWRRETSLGPKGEVLRGRLWERHTPLPPLAFGPSSFELCRWLASGGRTRDSGEPLESGDELLAYLACVAAPTASGCPIVRHSALAWLGFPEMMSRGGADVPETDAFSRLTEGALAVVVEALTDVLAMQWCTLELAKPNLSKVSQVALAGAAQSSVLAAWLVALEKAERRDLATFMVRAATALLDPGSQAADEAAALRPRLDSNATLRERQDAVRLSGAFLRQLGEVGRWYEDMRYVRPFEDNYKTAQALLRMWKPLGRRGFAHAAAVLRELEAFEAITGD